MAACIDTRHMVEHWIPDHENHLDDALGSSGRFQMHRVFALATVIHDPAMMKCLSEARGQPLNRQKQALLNSQPSQDDDQNAWEVFKDLDALYKASLPDGRNNFAINRHILIATAESRSFSARTQGRPASSFRRYSIKISILRNDRNGPFGLYMITHTDLQQVFGPIAVLGSLCRFGYEPQIVCSNTMHRCAVFWNIQIDFVDMENRTVGFLSGKRRREMNPFLQVFDSARSVDRSQARDLERKRFRGVRFRGNRGNRGTFVAEMKTPGSRNKTSFGDFKSAKQAARAVDVAFYHYGGRNLNFTDTPQIMAAWPPLVGLVGEEKLRLVKEQAKRVASGLPPSSPISLPSAGVTSSAISWLPFEAPEHSTDTFEFRSFSGITSSMATNYSISQPLLPCVHPNPMTTVSNEVQTMAPYLATAGLEFELQEGQSMLEWSEGGAIEYPVDMATTQTAEISALTPNSEWSTSSTSMHITNSPWDSLGNSSRFNSGWSNSSTSMQITEPCDSPGGSGEFFTPFGSSGVSDELQIDSPFLSPPTPMCDQTCRDFQFDFGCGFGFGC